MPYQPKAFLISILLLLYVIFINSPGVKAFLAKSKAGKIFRVFRRSFWAVVFLAFFWWFNVEHFIAVAEFTSKNNRFDMPIEEIETARNYKEGGIIVYVKYEGGKKSQYAYYMPSKLDWLING